MKRSEATNTFQEGMVMDFNPLTTPNNVVTNCLNGTLITFNGNEYVLLNDMGNGRVETAYLPEGYVPLGTAELGGIIYIVSYNPLIDKSLIGCFPSPERNITSDEIQTPDITVVDSLFRSGRKVTNTIVKVKLLSNPNSEDGIFKLNPGDKYTIFSTNSGITNNKETISDVIDGEKKKAVGGHKVDTVPKYVTIHVVSIGEDGKITYLDDSLKWTNEKNLDYYIKELDYTSKEKALKDLDSYRTLVTSAYNIFNSKVSGELALLFELKVIDSFSVAWDANVSDVEGDNDKEAEVTFDFEWTSEHPSINPSHIVLTESSTFKGETEVTVDKVCDLGEITGRENDGTDDRVTSVVGTFKYKSDGSLTDYVWDYLLTPSMPFGELDYLAIRGTINFVEIGSGKIEVDEWRYYIQENSFYLNWGLDAYPEKNKKIEKVTFTFIPFEKITSNTLKGESENYNESGFPLYESIGKSSYSGNFQEVINFGPSSKVSGEGIKKNYLYLVDVCAKYGNDTGGWTYRHNYKWLYTTGQWNQLFLSGTPTDFSELGLDNVLSFKPEFEKTDKIFESTFNSQLALPESAPENLEDMIYAAMGARVATVSLNSEGTAFDKSISNAEVSIKVVPSNYDSLFDFNLQSGDTFTNQITNKYITKDELVIDSDAMSVISEYVGSKLMEEGINDTNVIDAIKYLKEKNKFDSTNSNKAIDSFGASIVSGGNSKDIKLNVYGAIFSRINADLIDVTVEIGQRVRPLLYEKDDAAALGLNMSSPNSPLMNKIFKEGHKDLGGGKPFSFSFSRSDWGGGSSELKDSNKDYWNPSDRFSRDYYWDNTPPYNDWLNPWMHDAEGPFQILQYGAIHSSTVKANGTAISNKWGIWCKTDNGHFVPVMGFVNSTDKANLAKMIALVLMQVYYVDTEPTPMVKCIVQSINRLKTFVETWNIDIHSSLKISDKAKSVRLVSSRDSSGEVASSTTLETLQGFFSEDAPIDLTNITYNGSAEVDLGTATLSHSFRINSDLLYIEYENAKSTRITSLLDVSLNDSPTTSVASLNHNKLYVWDDKAKPNNFIALNEANSICIYAAKSDLNNLTISDTGTKLKLTKGSSVTRKTTKYPICKAFEMVDGELVMDEARLLSSKVDFTYNTQEGATYKGNSKYNFIGL